MPKRGLIITSVFMLGAIIASFQAGSYFPKYRLAREIGEINVKLIPLLIKPSDFDTKNISWEKAVHDFDIITRDKLQSGKAVSIMSGEMDGNNVGFVLIHEIIVYPDGSMPISNPSEYYNPSPISTFFPDITTGNEGYCWSSDINYLAECSITIKKREIISTFTIRIFEPNDQIAIKILPLAVEKFNERFEDSYFKK